jgi:hypothetical protein
VGTSPVPVVANGSAAGVTDVPAAELARNGFGGMAVGAADEATAGDVGTPNSIELAPP